MQGDESTPDDVPHREPDLVAPIPTVRQQLDANWDRILNLVLFFGGVWAGTGALERFPALIQRITSDSALILIVFGIVLLSDVKRPFSRVVRIGSYLSAALIAAAYCVFSWPATPLSPRVEDDTFSVAIPFTGGNVVAVAPYAMPNLANPDAMPDSARSLTTSLSDLSKLVKKPRTDAEINRYLCDLLQYYIVEYFVRAEGPAHQFVMSYQTAPAFSTTPPVKAPDEYSYPNASLIKSLSTNRFGRTPNRVRYWKQPVNIVGQLKVPRGTSLTLSRQDDSDEIEMSRPRSYTFQIAVAPALSLGNPGIIPPGFDVKPDARLFTRPFQFAVSLHFEYYRWKDQPEDEVMENNYANWAKGLFKRLRAGIGN